LAGITVDALNTTYSSIGGVLFNGTQSILIEYPGGGPGNYTVPVTVTNFGPYAFYDCPRLTGVYCQGNAPGGDAFAINMFLFDNETTVYYLPGTTGWGSTFAFRPTALWLPETQNIAVQANQFGFNVNWASGQVYVVEACTDLANPVWSPIATNTMTNAVSYFSDPQWTNFSARFYRFQLP
jgi:hypothetical protein